MADGNTATTPTASKKSALTLLIESLKGQTAPNKTDVKAITNAFKESMGKREALLKQLKELEAADNQTAINMVKCYGAKHVVVGGVRYVPTSRDERIYYKRMSDSHDAVEL